jgi:hypothetical protein
VNLFMTHILALRPKLAALRKMRPVSVCDRPRDMPKRGVYVLSEGQNHLYVGRSNDLRKRVGRHCRPSATARMASFAFLLARESTGNLKRSYRKGDPGTRAGLMKNARFRAAFEAAKCRIREMQLRFVEESDPTRQALLEICIALELKAPYNDFDTH